MKVMRWFLVALPVLPLLLFTIPRGMTLMPEAADPWYTKYTTLPCMLAAFYVSPATALTVALGSKPFTPLHVICMLGYTGAVACCVYRLTNKKSAKPSTNARSEQNGVP